MAEQKSRNFATTENIGPQILSLDLAASDVLDSGPPLGIKQGFAVQPVRNGLLADGRTIKEIGDALGKGDLAAGDVDSSVQGGNVRFLHARHSTRIFVDVNKDIDSTNNKGSCSVVSMLTAKKKKPEVVQPKAKRPKKPRVLEVGPDGRTMPERLKMIMTEHEPPFIPERGGQTQLARACQLVYANGRANAPATIQQGHIWELLNGQDSSRYLPVVAKVLGVNCLWLQFGIGSKYPTSEN